MTRTLGTIILTLTLAAPAVAAPGHHHPAPRPNPGSRPVRYGQFHTGPYAHHAPQYHVRYGTRFAYGFYYQGYHHTHWSRVYVHPVYGCRVYYDPYTLREYYWCAPALCYYPITYCPYGTYVFP